MRLPLTDAGGVDGKPTHTQREPVTRRGLKVVIVEDNDDSREMLCELLDAAGFACRSAADGLAGLSLIEEVSPDVALVDIGLPGMTGLELAQSIRSSPQRARTYLIALTGYGQHEDRQKVLDAGFDHHLVKPVDPAALIRALSRGTDDLVFES